MNPAKKAARRLSAILVADLVGYTGRMRQDQEGTYRQVKADLAELFLPRVKALRGRVVKTMGDGLLAEFRSVVDCLECALDVQRAITAEKPGPEALKYRVAIDVGEIIREGGDIYGDGVNVATRLQSLSEPGGIVITSDAYRQVRGKVNVLFEDLGEHAVKGIDEPVRVYRVGLPAPPADHQAAAAADLPPRAPSIAVLPFGNLSGDPAQSYFSDGISSDIVTDLSKFSQLFVLASHSVFNHRNRAGDIAEISRKLGIRYIVEGSVQSAGDRLRINVQLIEGESGRHLWAERYDRPIAEIFTLQDEIVRTIVGTVVERVNLSEYERVLRSKPDSLQAYDAYLRGRAAFAVWTEESNRQAEAYFRRAIALDPRYALAYGYLSYTLVQAWLGGWRQSPETLAQACALARQAVALGPSEFDNHWSLAAASIVNREYDKGIATYERALELNPNCPNLIVDMAEALVYVGRPQDAILHIRRAMLFTPIYPDWYLWTLGIALYHAGEYEKCIAALTKGTPPNLARRHLAAAYVRLERMDEARLAAAEFMKNDPSYTLARERFWPYRDPRMLDALLNDLRSAGLPERPAGV